MTEFRITFLALSRTTELEIKSENEIEPIVNDLLMVFIKEIDYENFKISIESLQQNTTEFRTKIDAVVQKYNSYEPKIQQINSYFKDLKDSEHFFVFPNIKIPKEQSFQFYNYLSALEKNEDFEKITKQMDELFGILMNSYEMFAYDENTRNKIGEPDKSKRVCRFCNKTNGEVSFKKVAHTISEALGNKKIITNDECDICNEKFGTGIENDLILYLNLYRSFFGIKGKNGIPKLKGRNFEIENKGTIEIKQYLTDEEIKDPNRDDFKLRLETTQNFTAQNVYKTLTKYALGVIDREQIANFSGTIEWLNGIKNIDQLPKVAMLTSYDLFSSHPKLMLYLRKTDDNKLPYAVAELRFTFLTFVYIIPSSNKDKTDFTQEDNFKCFWEFFKHYSSVPHWKFQKMNDNTAKPFAMNLNFELKEKK
jgi:hypothetical protein